MVMPRALPKKIDRCYEPLVKGMKKYKIDTPLRAAHFIAQIGHETASFLYMEEIADGSQYEVAVRPRQHAAGRRQALQGPRPHSADRPCQLRGVSNDCGIDYVTDPTAIATDPFACVDVACWYWHKRKINRLADKDDVKAVTKAVNGGFNGLDDRMDYLYRSKAVLGIA